MSHSNPHAKAQQQQIDACAADWVARLGGAPLSAAEHQALHRWLDADPAHARAFAEAQQAWQRIGELRLITPAAKLAPRRHWQAAAVLMSGLLLALLATLNVDTAWVLLNADYRTGPGERRALRLSDGSHVDLGPESALAVRFTARQRCVELLAGLAYFAPQPRDTDERRPFRVTAADGTVTALGTRFVVDQLGAVVDVVVAEDRVEVALAETARVVLASGQTVRYGGNGLGEVQAVNLNHVTAWRRDRLIVNQRPLREVITVLNRYRRGRIILAGRALAARRVSGVFDLAQPDTALAAIARDLKLKRLTLPLWVTLLH